MDLNLKDKVFLISGGAKGIGEAITMTIAAEGGIPVIIDPSETEGANLLKKLEASGGTALHICKRLTDSNTCKSVINESLSIFDRIDGVVNNAGVNDGVGLEDGSPEAFSQSIQKNLNHYYDLTHFALPHLIKSKGSIVNISSKTALTGQGSTSGYAAAKGAQLALTREWAVELLKYGIRVNAVIPAEVFTPLYQKWINTYDNPESKLKEIESRIPLGNRMTTAQEIADMVVFLLSARATHITGQHLFVDGGYTHLDRALNTLNP
ncbi:L-fucose dehydrogenase [Pararhodonellum marinum]|uniref:SDR family oxidoreductase n=1 Tax=Pararhodonellum marinum TaxID=2755358 RepID=UPI00188ED862|nr:SDR family oxidoreductase [Pararhodonellum marinum]